MGVRRGGGGEAVARARARAAAVPNWRRPRTEEGPPAAAAAVVVAVVAAAVAAVVAAATAAGVLGAARETGWGLLAHARFPLQEQRGVLIKLQGRTRQAVEAALLVVVMVMEGAARMQRIREGGAVGVPP